jgi:hypothetical protein
MRASALLAWSAAGPWMKTALSESPRLPAFSRPRAISRPSMSTPLRGHRRDCQDPQQQLTRAAAVVGNGLGARSGQFGGEPVSALGGKRPV